VSTFALFDSPIGRCGIAWGDDDTIVGVQLPEARVADTRARLRDRFDGARSGPPPAAVQQAIDSIVASLRGEADDLVDIPLDLDAVAPFQRKVYEVVRAIPPGETMSYGEVAAAVGSPGAARAVGQALGRNPFAIVVPCHRVLAAGGRTGGFSANGGVSTKLRILAIEGVRTVDGDTGFPFDRNAAADFLRASDTRLARLIDRIGPFTLELAATPSVFDSLAEAIVHQQLSIRAAATIYGRIGDLFPRTRRGFTPADILRASDEQLRGAGLSRAKVLALRDLAQRAADGSLPTLAQLRRLGDDEIVDQLSAVRGIGRWSAEMFLIMHLGRPDVLPVDDFGLRRGFQLAFRTPSVPTPAQVARRAERWRPFRTVASWYLWRALEL
jgi:methylated-DNA-[protein]-cysteine S-methyltransferase